MCQFKIEHFENEYGKDSFPAYRTLTSSDVQRILESLRTKLEFPFDLQAPAMLEEIDHKSIVIEGIDATEDSFNLRSLLHALRYSASTVFMNWNLFDEVDEFEFEDLCTIFNDILYPPADDLDILDSNLTWLISVRHYGAVKVLRLNRNNRDRM